MRLDQALVKRGLFESRHQAQTEIKHARIKVNGSIVLKPSHTVIEEDEITLLEAYNPYVSQGGLKLEKALKTFNVSLTSKRVLDIGASTGGFTDCALKHGASHVTTIDVGTSQIHQSLMMSPHTTVFEQTNFLEVSDTLITAHDFITMDVSFTSSIPLVKHAYTTYQGEMIVLLKPQFEIYKPAQKGVIRDQKTHTDIINTYQNTLNEYNLYIKDITYSPIKGQKGNIEFLLLISQTTHYISAKDITQAAHTALSK
jgi:23S rRNA (cytidine1920-2'-O)/16S rRNA (cytidine1409-2'-O)-methyltransferase